MFPFADICQMIFNRPPLRIAANKNLAELIETDTKICISNILGTSIRTLICIILMSEFIKTEKITMDYDTMVEILGLTDNEKVDVTVKELVLSLKMFAEKLVKLVKPCTNSGNQRRLQIILDLLIDLNKCLADLWSINGFITHEIVRIGLCIMEIQKVMLETKLGK
ncbi:hypothetical protein ACOME3_007966 [Neoechinorhynchus agilis]